ncbi:MFS transporter [Rhodococcus sp. SRB_17]|nr:MFS transporter [Rhodococcus sp. SRB_17]
MPTDQSTAIESPRGTTREVKKVILSSYLGSVLEYYDFLLYGTASALVFGPVFFSGMSSTAGILASFATFAAGYLARPLGGLIFGSLGDRVGRKSMLVLSLAVMGTVSVFIGLIPSAAAIGSWAPVMLVTLRVIQGIAIGGEWGGAVLMSLEHAGDKRRGLVTAFTYAGAPTGGLLGTLAMALASRLPEDQFLDWGWRIPFLASGVLLLIGLWVRRSINESPVFLQALEQARQTGTSQRATEPLADAFRQWPALASAATSGIAGFALQTVFATFAVTYAISSGSDRSTILIAASIAQCTSIATGLLFAALSDRVGRRPVMIGGVVGGALWIYPFFILLERGEFLPSALAFVILSLCTTAMHGPMPAFITEQFGTLSRYTGASFGYQLATLIGGGLAPLAVAAIFSYSNNSIIAVAVFVIVLCAISGIALAISRETKDNDLETVGT